MFTEKELTEKFTELIEEIGKERAVIKLMSIAKKDNAEVTMATVQKATGYWDDEEDKRLKLQGVFRSQFVNPLRVHIAQKKFGMSEEQAEKIFKREASDEEKQKAEEVKALLPRSSRISKKKTAEALEEYDF